jgi:phosphatidylglycerophosphatase A
MADGVVAAQRTSSSVTSVLATALATGFGAGYSRFAPGTAGTLVGLVLFWPIHALAPAYQLAATVVLFLASVAASGHVARRVGRKDPGLVVADEIVGMWITLLFVPLSPAAVVAGFLLFRAMDILKPPPARGFESLPGGWGIVMDDVMAGVYANLLLHVGLWIWGRM